MMFIPSSCPSDEEMIVDLVIENLRQRLEFTTNALHEREEEIEHYKHLVTTLENLLYGNSRTPSSEPKKITKISKGKTVSFHNDVEVRFIPCLIQNPS